MASSSSTSSSSMPGWEYDVFLSFHGEDTRKTFVSCLYMFLSQRGFRTFKDDNELDRGKFISPELEKNINESRIAVIVFSKNYASSSWCLDELVEILECRRTKGQIILPLFYDVKPTEVRKQTGNFGEAFTRLEGIRTANEVKRWRAALKEAADISGLVLEDAANGYWDKFFQKTVEDISKKLQYRPLKVAEYEVGIVSRADKLIMLLKDTSEDKVFVGICGIGGIGKTTVTKAVFNRIHNEFERSCFLENVRAKSTQRGLAKLQKELLRVTLMDNNIRISNSDMGINEIKERLQHKKILIVLDDVDDEKQLLNLVGIGYDWFDSGSRIIITTRNEWLLRKHGVKIFKAELLDEKEALELFSWHAFKQNNPEAEYQELSHRVKVYAQGLPLALQVLGSLLCQKSIPYWVNQLDKLKKNPPEQIQDVLKISYDDLDKNQKAIFLDIACFFEGYDKNSAMEFFEGCEFQPVIEIEVLIERSLITISEYDEFLIHDLIQEMGREIVRQESKDPGRRSRLWSYEDIYEVFVENTVTNNIEGIVLTEVGEEGLIINPDAFSKMKKLRILIISGGELLRCPTYLSNQLRCIDWKEYPGECLPLPKNLVQLRLPYSRIKQIQMDKKFHEKLKVIDFSYNECLDETLNFYGLPCLEELILQCCRSVVEVEFHDMMKNLKSIRLTECKNLKKTPNLSRLPCLEMLYLEYCKRLVEVHPSIEFHERLVLLDFRYCKNLKILSRRINLKSLESLHLEGCSKLEKFPEIQGNMECLRQLYLNGTAIKELPSSVERLKSLLGLNMSECKMLESLGNNIGEMKNLRQLQLNGTPIKKLPLSMKHLKHVWHLRLDDCRMLGSLSSLIGEMKSLQRLTLGGSGIQKIPSFIAKLTNLTMLDCDNCNLDEESILNLPHSLTDLILNRNNFASLPTSFTQLTNLTNLDLDGCLSLQTLESLPSSINKVSAQGCVSLERYSIPTGLQGSFIAKDNRCWIFSESHKLVENHGNNKPDIYSESQLQDIGESYVLLPGSEIPSWFTCKSGEDPNSSVCFRMDPNSFSNLNLKGIAVCAVIGIDSEQSDDDDDEVAFGLTINGFIQNFTLKYWVKSNSSSSRRSDRIIFSHRTHPPFRPDVSIKQWICNSSRAYIKPSVRVAFDSVTLKVKRWGIHLVMDPPARAQVST